MHTIHTLSLNAGILCSQNINFAMSPKSNVARRKQGCTVENACCFLAAYTSKNDEVSPVP